MIVYRLVKAQYASDLSGTGSLLHGGRWSSKGVRVLYVAESPALALLETLVGLPDKVVPEDFSLLTIEVPTTSVFERIDVKTLPEDWKDFRPPYSLRHFGDDFVMRADKLMLQVPSVIVPEVFNYLINPAHEEFKQIQVQGIKPFEFDLRLLRKLNN